MDYLVAKLVKSGGVHVVEKVAVKIAKDVEDEVGVNGQMVHDCHLLQVEIQHRAHDSHQEDHHA